ncbi:MAG: RNA polymerase sigma factor [Anaerolineae bacterium]
MDEHEAIRQMKQGDINGLAVLVNRYQTRAVRVATLITRDQSLAEDVVQATFIRIYKKIDQFDTTRPFAPWFMRSVVNGALQTMRKQQLRT